MGKTWSGLLKLCAASSSSPPLSKLSLLSAEAYSPPAQPRPNLNAAPGFASRSQAASRRLPPLTFQYTVLYWAAPTLVTQRNRAQTTPPDCSQTRLKTDQQTTPQTDSVYLSEQPLLHIRIAKRHSCYTDNKLSLIFDPKKRVICNWYIFATFGLIHSSSNLIQS